MIHKSIKIALAFESSRKGLASSSQQADARPLGSENAIATDSVPVQFMVAKFSDDDLSTDDDKSSAKSMLFRDSYVRLGCQSESLLPVSCPAGTARNLEA